MEPRVPVRPEHTHRLTPEQFGQLCVGPVDAETVALLRSGQYSRRRMLLAALVSETGVAAEDTEKAWKVITGADRTEPDLVADVLMSPSVGVWLARTLRRVRGASSDGPDLVVELGFLTAVAAAVAVRGRVPCVLRVPAAEGVVTLPTVGQVRFATSVADAMVTVTADRAEVAAERLCAIPGGREFVPVRRLTVASGDRHLTVEVDDSTPYREFSAPMPPGDPARLDAWTARLSEAWRILTRWHPAYADEIAAGVASLTPVPAGGRVVGFSSPMAFGAVAVSMGDSAAVLAARFAHEFQHSKLNAALDLVRLQNGSGSSWYAPWRDDPRPLGGLLHGIYAFTGDVEFWAVQRHHVADPAATFQFAYRRRQVAAVVEALDGCADLTAAGRELVAATAVRLARCPADDVPPEVAERSVTVMVEHRATWRLRHLRPDTDHVEALMTAWSAGAPPPAPVDGPTLVVPFRRSVPASKRTTGPEPRPAEDHAFATGAYKAAVTGYARRLRAAPADGDAWVGLGLTLRATGHPAAAAFLTAPETAATAWQRLAGDFVSPVDFGTWLAAG
jgi:HEXXH motif-containing protein